MFREISVDLSSDCDCPNCLEGVKSESDSNSCSKKRADGSIYSRSRKQSISSFNNASFKQSSSTQCSSSGLESDNKEDSRFLPPEKENAVEFSKKKSLSLSPEDISTKIRPLKELTIQELLREFGEPNSTSLGHFRDQVVMKFRRALYYSGIWVTHVRGYKFEKHFSANYFKRNPGSLHRVIPWLKRELTAVYGDYGYTVKNILVSILHHMTKYDLDSESFIHLLEPYLHQHTHHFLHEFISFVQSPYNMETYDQRAIYHCPSIATEKWVKKKPFTSAPILPLPEDYTLPMSQHDTKQPKSTQNQWNEERPQSDLKYFLNGNYSLKHSKIPQVYHETTCKIHVGNKDKTESGNHNHIISTNNMLLDWATPKERDPGMLNCKKQTQEKKTIGIKLCPSHVQDQKSDTNARTFSTPVISNQVQPWKYNLREVGVLSLVQQANFQKKGEKNKYSDSSPKIFQRLPRERSLMNCKPRKRDPSWSGISDNILSPKRDGSKLSSFRKKKVRCKQSSSSVEVGSHSSRRLERRSRSNNNRSKSWCVGPRNRSTSRESSNLSLGRNHRTEPVTQNMCCEPSKERNTPSYKSSYERISLTPVPYVKLSSTAGKRPNCPCKDEGASPSVSHHNSSTCLEIEKHRSPRKQEMKHKTTSPRARRTRAIHRKNKRQHTYKQTPEEVSDALGDLDDIKQVSCLSECAPACRRQIQKNQKPSLLKGHESSSQE